MDELKNLVLHLNEEINYYEGIKQHQKKLEATLWGIEEQSRFPENSSKEDQLELNEEMNRCRIKISNCTKLMSAQEFKVNNIIRDYLEKSGF